MIILGSIYTSKSINTNKYSNIKEWFTILFEEYKQPFSSINDNPDGLEGQIFSLKKEINEAVDKYNEHIFPLTLSVRNKNEYPYYKSTIIQGKDKEIIIRNEGYIIIFEENKSWPTKRMDFRIGEKQQEEMLLRIIVDRKPLLFLLAYSLETGKKWSNETIRAFKELGLPVPEILEPTGIIIGAWKQSYFQWFQGKRSTQIIIVP